MRDDFDLVAFCHEHGLRLTGQRKTILEVLLAANDHPNVEELYRRVAAIDPGIAIATVYRTVGLLAEKGILERHVFADGTARYEPSGAPHHDHFINVDSGEVVEFRSEDIERLQQEIARQHGFEIVDHKLEIYVRPLKKPLTEK